MTKQSEVTIDEQSAAFLLTLASEISRIKQLHNYPNQSDSFVHWCVEQLCPSLPDKNIIHAVSPGGPGDKGIDAAWYDDNFLDFNTGMTGVFFVAQGKCSDDMSKVKKFNTETIDNLLSAQEWLQSSTPKAKQPEHEAVRKEYRKRVIDEGRPVKFVGFISGKPQSSLLERFKDIDREEQHSSGKKISFEIFDIDRLHGLFLTRLETSDLPIPEELSFNISTNRYQKDKGVAKALIADVPLDEIHRLVADHGLALFARNLRVPIARSRYNKGMRDVLNESDEIDKFWYYNNGITGICESYRVHTMDDDPDHLTTVTVKGLQIVNGCQTCFTVYDVGQDWRINGESLDSLSNNNVLLRLIEVGHAERESSILAHKIARYTNSQTPITPRDLRATDPEQGRLKERFNKDWKYFFQVKKDEWNRRLVQDRSIRTQFEYPFFFDNEFAGQGFVCIWLNRPTLAKGGKKKIFEENELYETIYGFSTPVEGILFSAQMLHVLDLWRKKRNITYRSAEVRKTNVLTKQDVFRHGNFYILAMTGSSLMDAWKIKDTNKLNTEYLEPACENLKDLIPSYGKPPKGRLSYLCRELDQVFDKSLSILYQYAKEALREDPESTIRNLLVRPTTWDDLQSQKKDLIIPLARDLSNLLENVP